MEYAVGNHDGDGEGRRVWCVDIGDVLDHKQRARALHRSQRGEATRGTPPGPCLAPDLPARSIRPVETFFHASSGPFDTGA